MTRTSPLRLSAFLVAALSATAAEDSDGASFAFAFSAEVQAIEMAGRDEVTNARGSPIHDRAQLAQARESVIAVGVDPRFLLRAKIVATEERDPLFAAGAIVTFLVHSPTRTFPFRTERPVGETVRFILHGTRHAGDRIGFSSLTEDFESRPD